MKRNIQFKPLIEKIQDRLSKAIIDSGMTQAEIAAKIGVSQQTVSDYKCCKKAPPIENLSVICELLDLDANYILCLED